MNTRPAAGEQKDISLFDEVYRLHNRPVYAYLRGRCRETDAATDLLQETFLRAWRHLDEIRRIPGGSRLYWLLAVARNVANDHYRRQAVRRPFAYPLPETLPSGDRAHDPVASAENASTASEVEQALAALPEDLRVVVSLRYLGDLNSAEIAQALDRPAGTVRYQLSQARALLAQNMRLMSAGSQPGEERNR